MMYESTIQSSEPAPHTAPVPVPRKPTTAPPPMKIDQLSTSAATASASLSPEDSEVGVPSPGTHSLSRETKSSAGCLVPKAPGSNVDLVHLKEELFPSKSIHQQDLCKKYNCTEVSRDEKHKIGKAVYKCNHGWLGRKDFCYSEETGIWWGVYAEGEGLFCILCSKHDTMNTQNKSKIFNKEPCTRIRPEAFKDHSKTLQHTNAIEAELLQRESPFQKELNERKRVADDVLEKAFTAAYWLMKEEMPNHKVKSLVKLLEELGIEEMRHFHHRSQRALREIFLSLGSAVEDKLVDEAKRAGHFGIMVDEVTDIAVLEQMVTFIQFNDTFNGEVKTALLSIDNLLEEGTSADAANITKTILQNLEQFELDPSKLCAFVSDGAAVMTGKRSGVAARLKEVNPELINVHCICHRLALACTDTLDGVSYIKNVHTWLMQLWSMFENSPKKLAAFLKTQVAMKNLQLSTEEATSQATHRLKKACKTRWLSFDYSVKAVDDEYPALLQTLRSLKERDAIAQGLFMKIHQVKFIATIYILRDILPHLSMLSRSFQKGVVDFSQVGPTIEFTIEQLDKVQETMSPLLRLKDDLQEGGRLSGLEMSISDHQIQESENLVRKYIGGLKDNIDKRFKESLPVMSAFALFDPLKIPNKDQPGFREYGQREVVTLAAHFTQNTPEDRKQVVQDEIATEFAKFKYDMVSWKVDIPKECQPSPDAPCKVTATEWCLKRLSMQMYHFQKLSSFADIILSTPVSNAWPERVASCVKRVKTRFRSTLKNDILQALMQVSVNGPEPGTDQAKAIVMDSVSTWKSIKPRRRMPKRGTTQQQAAIPAYDFANRQLVDAAVQATGIVSIAPITREEVQDLLREEVSAFAKACDLPAGDKDDDDYLY